MKRILQLLAIAVLVLFAAPAFASPPELTSLTAVPTVRHVNTDLVLAAVLSEVSGAASSELASLVAYGTVFDGRVSAASVPGAKRLSCDAYLVEHEVVVDTGESGEAIDTDYERNGAPGVRPTPRHPPARAVQV